MSTTTSPTRTFGQLVRERRKAKGLSQTALGRQLGGSQQMISQYEKDETEPAGARLAHLLVILDITASEAAETLGDGFITSFMYWVSDLGRRLRSLLTNRPFRPLTAAVR